MSTKVPTPVIASSFSFDFTPDALYVEEDDTNSLFSSCPPSPSLPTLHQTDSMPPELPFPTVDGNTLANISEGESPTRSDINAPDMAVSLATALATDAPFFYFYDDDEQPQQQASLFDPSLIVEVNNAPGPSEPVVPLDDFSTWVPLPPAWPYGVPNVHEPADTQSQEYPVSLYSSSDSSNASWPMEPQMALPPSWPVTAPVAGHQDASYQLHPPTVPYNIVLQTGQVVEYIPGSNTLGAYHQGPPQSMPSMQYNIQRTPRSVVAHTTTQPVPQVVLSEVAKGKRKRQENDTSEESSERSTDAFNSMSILPPSAKLPEKRGADMAARNQHRSGPSKYRFVHQPNQPALSQPIYPPGVLSHHTPGVQNPGSSDPRCGLPETSRSREQQKRVTKGRKPTSGELIIKQWKPSEKRQRTNEQSSESDQHAESTPSLVNSGQEASVPQDHAVASPAAFVPPSLPVSSTEMTPHRNENLHPVAPSTTIEFIGPRISKIFRKTV